MLALIRQRRGSVVVSTSACHAGSPGSIPGPGTYDIIRCKNLALYIRDCVSLCLSDETLKSRWSLLSGVYARGSKISHQSALEMCNLWTPHSSLEKDNSLNHSCVSPKIWAVWSIQTKNRSRHIT